MTMSELTVPVKALTTEVVSKLCLGCCPHGEKIYTGAQSVTDISTQEGKFIRTSSSSSLSKQEELDINVKVSILWGLASANVNYNLSKHSGDDRKSLYLLSTLKIDRSLKTQDELKKVGKFACQDPRCKDTPFYLQAIRLGGEAELFIELEFHKESSHLAHEVSGKLSVFGISLSKGLKDVMKNYNMTNSKLHIRFLSTLHPDENIQDHEETGNLNTQLQKIEKCERYMQTFSEQVHKANLQENKNLVRSYTFVQCPETRFRLTSSPYEAHESLLKCMAELNEVIEQGQGVLSDDDLEPFKDVHTKLRRLCNTSNVTLQAVRAVYGDVLPNHYRRKLKRLLTAK